MHLASWKGDLEIVKLLITHGMSRPNVDQQSNSEDTALHLASQYGYSSVVEFLLEVSVVKVVSSLCKLGQISGLPIKDCLYIS